MFGLLWKIILICLQTSSIACCRKNQNGSKNLIRLNHWFESPDARSWACSIGFAFSWCPPPSPAEAWSDESGGPGGTAFSPITCRSDEVLVGLYGKTGRGGLGPFILSLGPICAVARFDWRKRLASISGDLRKVDEAGRVDEVGPALSEPFELTCPPQMAVIGSELNSAIVTVNSVPHGLVAHEYLVTPLGLRCSTALSSDNTSWKTVTGAGERLSNASRKPFVCPSGSVGFGIRGRAGQFVDAVRLGCRRA